jgi:2-dehydropantoate 2-reductase
MTDPMRIAIVGAGGQGGFFGGLLAASGQDVTLIDRGAHLEAILRNGLTLRPLDGDPTVVRVPATDDPGSVGRRDLVFMCVKTYDLTDALAGAAPLVGPETVILSVQNGIDAPDAIAGAFGADRVLAGVSYVASRIEEPGVISFGGVTGRLMVGELEGGRSERSERVVSTFRSAGLDAQVSVGIRTVLWEKLILLCATGGVMAFLRLPWGPVLDSRAGRELARGVMEEAEAVAVASGADLAEGTAARVFDFARANVGRSTRSSMLQDLLAGRRLELDALNGTVVRLGRALGVPTPLNTTVCAALEPFVQGRPGRGT